MAQQCIDQSVLAMTGTRMNDKSGRFVNHDDIIVFEENVERNRLRSGLDPFQRRLTDFNLIAGSHKLPRPRSGTVETNETGVDQLLNSGAGIFRKFAYQKPIETQPCIFF
jgi:hypothetical protein